MKSQLLKKMTVLVMFMFPFWGGAFAEEGQTKKVREGTALPEFHFSHYQDPDTSSVDKALVSPHFLGEDVSVLYYIFRQTYVADKNDNVGGGSFQEAQKPVIYNSVLQINKLLKKAVKKGTYTREEAAEVMKDCLRKSYSIFFADTKEFEAQLSDIDGLEQYLALYRNISFE